jgi:hypothetical protein
MMRLEKLAQPDEVEAYQQSAVGMLLVELEIVFLEGIVKVWLDSKSSRLAS